MHALIDILLAAPSDGAVLELQLERLWTAIEEAGVDFLSEVADRWGALCRTAERASRAADDVLPVVRLSWRPEHRGHFRGTTALGWMAADQFYELKAGDAWKAMSCALRAAEALGRPVRGCLHPPARRRSPGTAG